jgi:hypothetical protein
MQDNDLSGANLLEDTFVANQNLGDPVRESAVPSTILYSHTKSRTP